MHQGLSRDEFMKRLRDKIKKSREAPVEKQQRRKGRTQRRKLTTGRALVKLVDVPEPTTCELLTEYHTATFSNKIIDHINDKKINMSDASARIGSTRKYLHTMLKSNKNFSLSTMVKIAEAVGVDIEINIKEKIDE